MKAIPFLLACVFLAGCDFNKMTSVDGSNSSPGSGSGNSSSDPASTPKPKIATPKPTPKQGEWMLKNYKNPLDPPKR